jgi:hypothetical protein
MSELDKNLKKTRLEIKPNMDTPIKNNIEILDIDVILDKIYDSGLDSLTINEKEFLNNQKK